MKHLAIIAASLFTISVVMSSCSIYRYGIPRQKYNRPLPPKKFAHNHTTGATQVYIAKN